jgi:pilus assembly protein CpaB
MRARTLILFVVAILLAGSTAMLVRSWLMQQRTVEAEAAPMPPPVQKSVLVAHSAIPRGQILKPTDLAWQAWPDGGLDRAYIQKGAKTIEDLAGWVARDPFGPGEPITEPKIVAPGSRGFLAAVLRPGMRAVSVPVTRTSGISGFVFPGDQVDILTTHALALSASGGKNDSVQHQASETVLHDIRVLAVDQKLDSKGGEAIVAQTATLEVTPKQSEIIAVASEMGKLSLSLRSLTTPPGEETVADSTDKPVSGTFTLDTEVSPLVPKPFTQKDNPGADVVTVLHGTGKSETSSESQPASRGL